MNSSSNITSHLRRYPLQDRSQNEVIAETVVACVLFILGVTGNSLVCYVIYKKRFTSSSMYFFMLNLAFADLLVCFASIPLTLLATRPQPVSVEFGLVGCKVIRFIQYMLPPASVAILTATAIDRYFHICIPLRRIITTTATKQLAGVCWGSAIIITLPIFYLIESEKVSYEGKIYHFCNIHETSNYLKAGTVYLTCRGLVGFVLPLAVISVLYCRIVRTVWRRDSHHSTNKQKGNVVKSLLTVVIAFTLSWTPFSVCNKYYLYVKQDVITRQEIITFWIGLSASVYNPVIYAFFNKKFRDAFSAVVFGKKSRHRAQAAVVAANRPRSHTLPALLPLDTTVENRPQVVTKSRHISIGCQKLLDIGTLSDETQFSYARADKKQRSYACVDNDYTEEKIHKSYACVDTNPEVKPKGDPTSKRRKKGVSYLLPPKAIPSGLRRSQTFHSRQNVTSGQSTLRPIADGNNAIYTSSSKTKLLKSKSFSGTETLKAYVNDTFRL